MGLVGLALLVLFVGTAAAAPWLAPFTPVDTAPSIDILEAHNVAVPLPEKPWGPPLPFIDASGRLAFLVLVSPDGSVLRFPVEEGRLELSLGEPETATLPPGTRRVEVLPAGPKGFLTSNETSAVRWGIDFQPLDAPVEFGFAATHVGSVAAFGKVFASTWASDHDLGLLAGREGLGASFGEGGAPAWWSRIEVADATIVGPPSLIILDAHEAGTTAAERGNLVVVPTDRDVRAYEVIVNRSGSRITAISLGDLAWSTNLTSPPAPGVSVAFPTDSADEYGKDRIVGASEDGTFFALDRNDGSILWNTKPFLRSVRDAVPIGLQGTSRGLLLASFQTTAGGGAIAALAPETGAVAGNHTQFVVLPEPVSGPLQYVHALKQHLFSTTGGRAYLVEEDLRISASFSIPGGSASPIVYVGNIFSNIGAPQKGNYFAAVTDDGKLFAQSTGNLRTPLPPGCTLLGVTLGETYPSGNCYLFGTDAYGHDIFSWLVWGTRAELYVGVTAAFVAVVIGTIVGLVSGYVGGFVDDLLMRITDINLTLPVLVIALLVVAMFGPSLLHVILIIAFLTWAVTARVIRSQTLSLKERPFINAARMSGASNTRIIFRHLAPNVLPFTFLFMTFGVSGAIIVEALLAFLGFGDPNAITWGMMLQFLYISGHTLHAPWWLIPPGLGITLLSLSFYLVGRAFDDIVNPRLRTRAR